MAWGTHEKYGMRAVGGGIAILSPWEVCMRPPSGGWIEAQNPETHPGRGRVYGMSWEESVPCLPLMSCTLFLDSKPRCGEEKGVSATACIQDFSQPLDSFCFPPKRMSSLDPISASGRRLSHTVLNWAMGLSIQLLCHCQLCPLVVRWLSPIL